VSIVQKNVSILKKNHGWEREKPNNNDSSQKPLQLQRLSFKKSIKAKQEARQTNVGLPFQANIWGKVGRGPGKSKSGQRPQGYIK